MESMRCTDLADILRAEGRQQSAEIIDVRRAWKDKQPLNDRNVVPPPVVLPMLLEADDFEDMMLSRSSATMWSEYSYSLLPTRRVTPHRD
jgi:hypothetical protein